MHMFSLFAKTIRLLSKYPKAVLSLFAVFAILSIYPIQNLHWELQLQDTLKGDKTEAEFQTIEKAFGALGSLTVVLQSSDSAKNFAFAKNLAETFNKYKSVHFTEYAADMEFFKKNRLLYASETDLAETIDALDSIRNTEIMLRNPFFVNLDSSTKSSAQTNIITKIESKYFKNLQQNFSNSNGTIRVVDIYPATSISDLQANRNLLSDVKEFVKKHANGINVFYAGKVYESVQTGKALLPEAKFAGAIAALIILILLIANFYKQPQLIIASALPMALPTIFTLAIAYILYGRINLFTLSLGLLLPGHACQIISHIYTQYFREREQKLSPPICIESALLGICPVVAASSIIMAGLFASCILIPLPGLIEFAILGTIGCALNLFVCPLLTTSLLRLAQRKKPFKIKFENKNFKHYKRPFNTSINWIIIIFISAISIIGWIYSGANLNFLYDFKKTEFQADDSLAQALIAQTGFSTYDPIIVMFKDSSYNKSFLQNFENMQCNGMLPDLARIYTQYQFLPKITPTKKRQIQTIKQTLDGDILNKLSTKDSSYIVNMLQSYESDIKEFELSEKISRKFADKSGNQGIFAFIIPRSDTDNGLICRHIFSQIKKLLETNGNNVKICGTPIIRATLLDMILGNVNQSIMLGTLILWLILLMFYNKLSRAFFTTLPPLFAMSWTTIIVQFLGIKISAYSALSFVLLIGASVDGSLQLWSAYYEKQGGSAWTVLRTKMLPVLVAQGASCIGALSMLISSHPGIYGMGLIITIGLVCIFISQFTIYPLTASALDAYRIFKKAQKRHEKFIG